MYAYSGNIGGWNLNTTGLSNGAVSFTTNGGLKLGNTFSVTPGGSLSATAGSIGGCKINGGTLEANNLRLAGNNAGWNAYGFCTGVQGGLSDYGTITFNINVPTYSLYGDLESGYRLEEGSRGILVTSSESFLKGLSFMVSMAKINVLGGQSGGISSTMGFGSKA